MIVYSISVIVGVLVIAAAFKVAAWEEWDDQRRQERQMQRDLYRMGERR